MELLTATVATKETDVLGTRHLKRTHTVAVELDRQLESDVRKEFCVVIYHVGRQLDRPQVSLLRYPADPIQHPELYDWPESRLHSASIGTGANVSTLGREEERQCRQATQSAL